ncbi:hypothetical protein [Sulfuriflexus sp.]|uniref:hypothetical protein n=1 Tax=Sulfuriflexus sp. TaxID=2015443 RepID=UPI0028CEA6AE|nr:hypothetical protein [Sulfuriflexus sp.]MDT8405288.1 hypothetical protein [Sulfuriflexus sp.]
MKTENFLLILCCVVFLPGCAIQAHKYEIAAENIQILKRSGKSAIRVGEFSSASPKINALTIRGSTFESPYNGSYEEYLKTAITEDLKQASHYAADSNIEVSGVLLKNEFDASGVNIGTASISARVIVNNAGTEKYNKVVTNNHEWESYFAAFSAVPAAQIGYVDTVRNFLKKLYSDEDFIKACK